MLSRDLRNRLSFVLVLDTYQGCRTVWKSGGGTNFNDVSVICPLPTNSNSYLGFKNMPKDGGGGRIYPTSSYGLAYLLFTAAQFQCMPIGGTRGMHDIEGELTV